MQTLQLLRTYQLHPILLLMIHMRLIWLEVAHIVSIIIMIIGMDQIIKQRAIIHMMILIIMTIIIQTQVQKEESQIAKMHHKQTTTTQTIIIIQQIQTIPTLTHHMMQDFIMGRNITTIRVIPTALGQLEQMRLIKYLELEVISSPRSADTFSDH